MGPRWMDAVRKNLGLTGYEDGVLGLWSRYVGVDGSNADVRFTGGSG